MNGVSLLKSLMNQLAKLESASGKRVIIRDYLNSQFSASNDATPHKSDIFLNAYTAYLVSRSDLNRLNGKYAKGERSIAETANMMTNEGGCLQGIWHPAGYYGAYMSRTRLDFNNRFRKSVKPIPPLQFENRYTTHLSTHPFSAHDNRHSFQNHGSYFGKDTFIGKRKITGRSYSAQKGILNWKPEREIKVYQGHEDIPHHAVKDSLFVHQDHEIFPLSKISLRSAYQDAFGPFNNLNRIYKPPHEFDTEPVMKSTYKQAYNSSSNSLPWTSRHSTHK